MDPVFQGLADCLATIELDEFGILDAACATGYYSEVISTLDDRNISYRGCDYSESMINAASMIYPEVHFETQDLTQLEYPAEEFDVVLVSGVLEHVPSFVEAVSHACRVATHYVIVHRCPLHTGDEHQFTIGSQYTIKTPRIYFGQAKFVELFASNGFDLCTEVPLYRKPQNLFRRLKNLWRSLSPFKSKRPRRYQSSLVFRRRANSSNQRNAA